MTSCPVSMQSLRKSSLSDRTVTSGCQVLEEDLLFSEFSIVSFKDCHGSYCRVFFKKENAQKNPSFGINTNGSS